MKRSKKQRRKKTRRKKVAPRSKIVISDKEIPVAFELIKTAKRFKRLRQSLTDRKKDELEFIFDSIKSLDKVIRKYNQWLSEGKFSTYATAQWIYKSVNYMMAAYQNLEKIFDDENYRSLAQFYNDVNLGKIVIESPKLKSKIGNMGKTHIPISKKYLKDGEKKTKKKTRKKVVKKVRKKRRKK